MEEYKTYTLEDISKGKGTYGIAAPAVDYKSYLYKYLRITDINDDGSLKRESMMSVSDDKADRYLLQKNDIVFARTGNSTGRAYFYEETEGELVYAGFLIKFSLDETKVNPKILKYYTHSQPYYNWVKSFDTGGTRGNINAKTFGSMPITLPSRFIQDRIVDILSSLDDKIELNRRINANLEEQAQALFKSWFIDFEPFKDGKFVDSELGMIPEGWRVEKIDNVVDIIVGGDKPKVFSKSQTDECVIPVYSNGIDNEGLYGFTDKPRILKDSVTISARGTIGYVCLRKQAYMPIVRLICLVPINMHLSAEYIYLWALNEHIMGVGTTQQQLTVPNFRIKEILLPTENVMRHFNGITAALFHTIKNNQQESSRLSSLRDTLLPKLMSGEIKLKD